VRPVSQRWLDTIRGSHQAVFEVRVCEPGQSGTDPPGTVVPIAGGDVQYDIESDILATVQVQISDSGLYPDNPGDLLAPYGNELFVRRGIAYGGGAVEWVSLGYFRINSVEQPQALGGDILVSGQDRMGLLAKAELNGTGFSAARTYGQIVFDLISNVPLRPLYPGSTIVWENTTLRDTAVGRQTAFDGDAFTFLDDLITSIAQVWYWDHRGYLVIKEAPNIDEPVWAVDAGADGVLVSMGKSISDEGVYNMIYVIGGSPDTGDPTPPQDAAYDTNPASPTYYLGKYGQVQKIITETLAVTIAQVRKLARATLQASIGLPASIDFTAVPNAALEPYDPITVKLRAGEERVHIIRRMTIPLDVDNALSAQTKEYVQLLETGVA
jgi:hypothetical protein